MAAEGGEHLSEIKLQLLEEGQTFSFVQAMRLLCHELTDPLHADGRSNAVKEILESRVRIRPELSLRFPGTDITKIEMLADDPEKYRITATFLGLYGASSPLPTFYTEDLIDERNEEGSIRREFLDIINHALYPLFFKIWSKYRLFYKVCEVQDEDVTDKLYCLLGLENHHLRKQIRHIRKFFRYTGLALQMPRSAEGLETMVEDCFGLQGRVRTEQCVLRRVKIPEDQCMHLGRACCALGEDAVLGEWVPDMSGKFRIVMEQTDSDRLHSFLPGRNAFVELSQLVNFYVNQSLECELVLELEEKEAETARIGDDCWSNLGWNTWLFSENIGTGKKQAVFSVK